MKPSRENPWTAVPFGFNFDRTYTGLGLQTRFRLARLVRAVRCDGYNIPHVLLCAGFPPLLKRDARQEHTMAYMMRSWLIEDGTFKPEQIIMSDDSSIWTSIGEIREAIRIIKRDQLPQHILAISTWNHVYPRLWITWRILLALKPEWHVNFASTKLCNVNMIHELAGTINYMPRAIAHRIRSS